MAEEIDEKRALEAELRAQERCNRSAAKTSAPWDTAKVALMRAMTRRKIKSSSK